MNTEKVKGAVEEMVNSMYLVQAQKDHQKAIVDRMKDEEGVDKAEFRKMAKYAYNLEIATDIAELEAINAKLAELGIA
jgi:hypothetical protein